jgi:hypothetical protein
MKKFSGKKFRLKSKTFEIKIKKKIGQGKNLLIIKKRKFFNNINQSILKKKIHPKFMTPINVFCFSKYKNFLKKKYFSPYFFKFLYRNNLTHCFIPCYIPNNTTNWSWDEEFILISLIQRLGYFNWPIVALFLGTKTALECERHFFLFFSQRISFMLQGRHLMEVGNKGWRILTIQSVPSDFKNVNFKSQLDLTFSSDNLFTLDKIYLLLPALFFDFLPKKLPLFLQKKKKHLLFFFLALIGFFFTWLHFKLLLPFCPFTFNDFKSKIDSILPDFSILFQKLNDHHKNQTLRKTYVYSSFPSQKKKKKFHARKNSFENKKKKKKNLMAILKKKKDFLPHNKNNNKKGISKKTKVRMKIISPKS